MSIMQIIRHVVLLLLLATVLPIPLRAEERLWVDCRINGMPVRLAFDTGASHAIIFSKTAERLGLKVVFPNATVAPPSSDSVALGQTEECEFSLSGNSFKVQFRVYDLPGYLRTGADGVLGWGALQKNIILIDASSDELAGVLEVPEVAKRWQQFRLRANADILTLEFPKNGHTNTVVLDTGSQGGIWLSPEKWRRWKAMHPAQRVTVNSTFLPGAGMFVGKEIWANEITIAPLHLKNVPIGEAHPLKPGEVSHEAIFGLTAMKQLQIVVDGEQGIAYVNVRSEAPQPYQHNRLGAVFVPNDPQKGTDLVAHVAIASPAAKAGIRDGDILLKIGETDVTKWRTEPGILPLYRFWHQPNGTQLQLTLRREQQLIEVDVTLEDILGPGL